MAESVTQSVGTIGLFLPTTPLHWQLLRQVAKPLVCTSGNREGEPLAFQHIESTQKLSSIADLWLHHSRSIVRPIDDSVVRVIAGRPTAMRLARGYAPRNLDLDSKRPLVAVGGHQKVSIALSNGAQAVIGAHIGDMDSIASRERFVEQVNGFTQLYGISDFDVVCDLHPDYFTTQWCLGKSNRCLQVQHHHAHIAAGMLEHGWLDQQVLGIAFDGNGFGSDGTIWGGEFLRCSADRFERVGHLQPFLLPGGEYAVREPWRVAVSLVCDAMGDTAAAELSFDSGDVGSILQLLSKPRLSSLTTSAGRLFDGVAALVLPIETCDYEGQAAIELEAICDDSASGMYEFRIHDQYPMIVDWRPMICCVMEDRMNGVSAGVMAMRFHRGLAAAIARVCREHSKLPVVLGGGVFQNRILVELLADEVRSRRLGLPGMIPVNDGGLAAGQLVVASSLLNDVTDNS